MINYTLKAVGNLPPDNFISFSQKNDLLSLNHMLLIPKVANSNPLQMRKINHMISLGWQCSIKLVVLPQ